MENEKDKNNVEKILSLAMEKLKNVADSSCTIGEPIVVGTTTIIPVSKISAGYVSGGGEYGDKQKLSPFVSGGSGGGYSVSPIGFLIVEEKNSSVKMLSIDGKNKVEKILECFPSIISSFKNTFKGGTKK